jgi:hypothetical protein
MVNLKKTLRQKSKVVHEDDLALSKNYGKSIKYRRRKAAEREAQAAYEDGLHECYKNIMNNG